MATATFSATMRTRKAASSSNSFSNAACQEFYDSSYNYVGTPNKGNKTFQSVDEQDRNSGSPTVSLNGLQTNAYVRKSIFFSRANQRFFSGDVIALNSAWDCLRISMLNSSFSPTLF